MKYRYWIQWVARLTLAGVFFVAGVQKLSGLPLFIEQIRAYDLLPDPWPVLFAVYLPWLEVFTALALLTSLVRGGALLAGLMSMAFIVGLSSAWARGLDIACGCFGDTTKANYPLDIAMNMGMITASVVVWVFVIREKNRFSGLSNGR